MSYPAAIVIAAGLIAGTLVMSTETRSQSTSIGRYQIAASANDGKSAWRVDTATGDMVYCVSAGSPGAVTCQGARP